MAGMRRGWAPAGLRSNRSKANIRLKRMSAIRFKRILAADAALPALFSRAASQRDCAWHRLAG